MIKTNRLETLRTDKGLTQEELAANVGIAVSTYSMYANGHRMIPRKVAERIADALDCELEEIFCPRNSQLAKHTSCSAAPRRRRPRTAHEKRPGRAGAGGGEREYTYMRL